MNTPRVGERAERSMKITDEQIEAFARLSGDRNPVHFDDAFARRIGFDGHIAHGAVTAALLSTLLGMDLPGPGSVFLEQRVRYLAPVRPGDTITGVLEVTKVRADKPIVTLAATISNQAGTVVADGELVVLVRDPGQTPAATGGPIV
jgi:acyl dehydratase